MRQLKKRKRGGQRKSASERKRNNVTIRLRDDLEAKMEAASRASGLSLSEEIAWRLTITFMFDNEIQEVSQIQRGLGDVMVEGLIAQGWGVEPEDPSGWSALGWIGRKIADRYSCPRSNNNGSNKQLSRKRINGARKPPKCERKVGKGTEDSAGNPWCGRSTTLTRTRPCVSKTRWRSRSRSVG